MADGALAGTTWPGVANGSGTLSAVSLVWRIFWTICRMLPRALFSGRPQVGGSRSRRYGAGRRLVIELVEQQNATGEATRRDTGDRPDPQPAACHPEDAQRLKTRWNQRRARSKVMATSSTGESDLVSGLGACLRR